jgi:hypothetical protein
MDDYLGFCIRGVGYGGGEGSGEGGMSVREIPVYGPSRATGNGVSRFGQIENHFTIRNSTGSYVFYRNFLELRWR